MVKLPRKPKDTANDSPARKRAEEELRQSQEKFSALLESAPIAAVITDSEGRIKLVNAAAEETFGYRREELAGQPIEVLMPARFRRDHARQCAEFLAHPAKRPMAAGRDMMALRKDGSEFPATCGLAAIETRDGSLAISFLMDITERKRAEAALRRLNRELKKEQETIRHQAFHDALTDLPNRALFKDRLTLALAQAHRDNHIGAVMFLDLDRFKAVNDTAGHAEGDRLLQSAGNQLKELVREGDSVARMGGDEFTLLLPGIDSERDAIAIAERIIEAFQQTRMLGGHELRITASIGITVYPRDGEDAETLLQNADIAMYRAKDEGRNNFQLYTPVMNTLILERLEAEGDLRHALECDQFVLHYQPQIEMKTSEVVGMEALIRWQHPERGLVPPMEFIPLAEETGLIVPLGEWVLRTACRQNKAWQEAGFQPVRIAVNLSGRQFEQPDLVETVARALNEAGLDPQCLELEITESTAMRNVDYTARMLQELKEMGVLIAIDDFGTGHSSLGYLKRFPVDLLKIDRTFVRDLPGDQQDAALATGIIAMAHELKLDVIAEGVETDEQAAALREWGCDEAQGYLFSKPVPASQSEKMLKRSGSPPTTPALPSRSGRNGSRSLDR